MNTTASPDFFSTLKTQAEKRWKIITDYFNGLGQKFAEDDSFFMASGIAFDTFTCLVPTVLLIIAVSGFVLGSSEASSQRFLSYLDNLLPFETQDIQSTLRGLITASGTVSIIGLLGLFWTVGNLIGSLRVVMARIFNIPETRNLIHSKLFDLGMVVVLGLMFLLSIGITSVVSLIQGFGVNVLGMNTQNAGGIIKVISFFLSGAFTFFMFFIAYKFIPAERVPDKVAGLAAIWATLLWEGAKQSFNFYITNLTGVQAMYGSLGIIIVLLLWIYFSGLIFIIAGEIGQVYAERHHLDHTKAEARAKSEAMLMEKSAEKTDAKAVEKIKV